MLCVATSSFAIDDTPENRVMQTERYLAASSPAEMMRDMADSMAVNMPPSERAAYRQLMTEYIDLEVLTMAIKESMVRIFTADELAALADLYESPDRKRVE